MVQSTTSASKNYTYRCGHPAETAPPIGTTYLYDCDDCRAVAVAAAKDRVGWNPGPVYTVIGEHGNSDGPYTRELPTLAAALEAIRTDDLPLCPISDDGGLRQTGATVSFTVRRSLCYEILEHEPLTGTDRVTGWHFGGIHNGRRVSYDLASGATATVATDAERPVAIPDATQPAEWREYRRLLAQIPPRDNYATVYRDVLGVR